MSYEAAFDHKLREPKLAPLTEVADVSIIVCSVDPHLARSRHMNRSLADRTRERFHGDRPVHVTNLISNYVPPKLDQPTLTVDTMDGHSPGLDEIVAFALQAPSNEPVRWALRSAPLTSNDKHHARMTGDVDDPELR